MKTEEKKELDIKQVFEIVKLSNFCLVYTDIDPKKGLYHRMKGYNTAGKPTELTVEDRRELAEGLTKLAKSLSEYAKKELLLLKNYEKENAREPLSLRSFTKTR